MSPSTPHTAPPLTSSPRAALAAITGLAALALLVGCAGSPHSPATSGPATPVSEAPVAPGAGGLFGSGLSEALEPQRIRLQGVLKGTPVAVEPTPQRQLRVTVPLRNSFEPGRSAVRPALAAVLDQLAVGFKPYAATAELHIAAPDDAKGSGRLAKERGASVRDYLVARGVPVSRVAGMTQADQEAVDVLISDRPLNK